MERSEPTLIPEWLKGSGAVSGGGTASRQMASSSLLSDDHVKPLRNKPSVSTNNHDIGRSFVSDRITSSDFRRSSSNGSGHLRSQGKFGSTNRDRDWEKAVYDSRDKEKSILGDHRRRQYSDPSENFFPSRFDKDLRRSQSMVTGKRGERWPGEVSSDLSNANCSNPSNLNGLLAGGTSLRSVPKASFERDFPSLGAEEREVVKIGRVSSPGLGTAVRSLPTAMVGGDGWTSALAEVPVLGGNSGSSGSVQQVIPPTSASLPSSVMSGLNMAETLVQCPSRSDTTPQLSAGTQRLEELAIKQSRQLVPMTPSMHKALVPNASEKPKPKLGQQQQQISTLHLGNHSPRSGHAKSDVSRISTVGKLQVLKPARESNGVSPTAKGSTSPTSVGMGKLQVLKPARERNGASPTSKDSLSPTSVSRVTGSPVAVAPSVVGSAPLRSSNNNPNLASAERKPAQATLEKRPTPQAQSRNDFFNLMRKKSMNSPSSAVSGPGLAGSSLVLDKADQTQTGSGHVITQDGDSPLLDSMVENRPTKGKNDLNSAGISSDWPHESLNIQDLEPLDNGKDNSSSSPILYSEEEEAAFLRSLGWEENGEEDEGLTEEEISSFYKGMDEYIKMRPSAASVFGKMQPNFLLPLSLRAATVGGGATTGSSDSKLES